MKRRWPWLLLAIALLLAGYVVAGPYLAVRAIGQAIERNDARALSRHVDFPALRESLKRQVGDRVIRSVGIDAQSSLLGAIGLQLAGGVVDAAVETMVTPYGLAAVAEGRQVWRRASQPPVSTGGAAAATGGDPLADARHRFESPSRFTASIDDDSGRPVVFVLTRRGLRWRLSDIQLPR